MSKIVLYGVDLSPPVRACKFALKALGLEYEYKEVDLTKAEHMSKEFLKHNPQHTVPVLDDNGVWLWDSHVICAYLAEKYGKNDTLYPKDLAQRAIVQQRLYFDASVLFMPLRYICLPTFSGGACVALQEKTKYIADGYDHLETFLGDNAYVVGNKLTIADFCCMATVSSSVAIVAADPAKYPKVNAWMQRMEQLPYYEEANGKGAREFTNYIKSKLA